MNKLIIVITAQRHASTELCNNLSKILVDFTIQHEIFNYILFPENIDKNPIKAIENKLLEHQNYGFKLFHNNIPKKNLIEIIDKFKDRLLIIFLRRPLEDSYKSLCKSLTTGNWGTTPEKQLQWDKDNREGYQSVLPSFQEYKNTINKWFVFVKDICLTYNINTINTININFDDVINKESLNKIKIEILNKLDIIDKYALL